MKGDRKRKKTHFKIGHRLGAKVRVDKITNDEQAETLQLTEPRVLRKRINTIDSNIDSAPHQGMRLLEGPKMVNMWNEVFRAHDQQTKKCNSPDIQIFKEKKVGVCWKYTLYCLNCTYKSKQYKLYEEVDTGKRGQKAAAPNVGLATGLQDTPIGPKRAQILFCAMDQLELVKSANNKTGRPDNEIDVSLDARYTSTFITSAKKPGQNASQSLMVAVENNTGQKLIVDYKFQNKLCWKGAWLKGQGFNVTCPGHAECTSNMHRWDAFTEFQMGHMIALTLHQKGFLIKHATTDGDGKSAAGCDAALKALYPLWNVVRQSDPVHVGRSMFRKSYSASYSSNMFVCAKSLKKQAKKGFSNDIKSRCSLVMEALFDKYAENTDNIQHELPHVLNTMLKCYDGDCSSCKRYGYVCDGEDGTDWWAKSLYLAPHHITVLNMNDSDKNLVKEILEMKLSVSVFERFKMHTDTQKNETFNNSLNVSLPKRVNFGRNVAGRFASTILRNNNPEGQALCAKAKATTGHELSDRVKKDLMSMDKQSERKKQLAKSQHAKNRRLKKLSADIYEHANYKDGVLKSDYKQGQLD